MKFRFLLLIISVLLFAVGCERAQNPAEEQIQNFALPDSLWTPTGDATTDSLLKLAAITPPDTNLARLYNKIADRYEFSDFEKAKEYYLKLKDLSEQLNWKKGYYWYAGGFATILAQQGLPDSALVIYQEAYQMAKSENNESRKALILTDIGNAYFAKTWYETAISCFMEALPYFEKNEWWHNIQVIYVTMSQIYLNLKDIENAIEYGEKAVALNKEDVIALTILAKAYPITDNHVDKAIEYYEEALRIATLENHIYAMTVIYYGLSDIAMMRFEIEKAEKYANQALEINKLLGSLHCSASYVQLSKIEQLKGNFIKAETYAKKALQLTDETGDYYVKKACYLVLSELAVAQHKYRENIEYWSLLEEAERVIARENSINSAKEMEAKYETAKKQSEIERQQTVIAKQNLQRWLLMGGIGACVLILVIFWYMLRLRARRNHALAELNATKDKFFSIISHDLKNPAIAQRDAIRMLFTKSAQWDTATLQSFCSELLHSADMQVELLYNLLGWAQLHSGRMIYQPETFDLAQRIVPELALIKKIADAKGVQFETEMPQACIITADAEMMATVVRNLLSNAVKFTPAGGTVKLACTGDARRTGVARNAPANAPANAHTVSISDTGTGITPEELQNIFRLDSRHSRRGTAGETGTGLGLIVCNELLEKHNTKLQVESEEGKGSRFWFEI